MSKEEQDQKYTFSSSAYRWYLKSWDCVGPPNEQVQVHRDEAHSNIWYQWDEKDTANSTRKE